MILQTLNSQRTHIIYGAIILMIGSLAYHFFKKDPEKIVTTLTKTETKIQTVDRIVNKDRIVYIDRTITTHKANGDVVVEVDKEHADTKTNSDTKIKIQDTTLVSKTSVESFMKNYSVETLFPVNPINPRLPNPLDIQGSFGMRLFSTPLWGMVGTTGHFNTALLGLRYEY